MQWRHPDNGGGHWLASGIRAGQVSGTPRAIADRLFVEINKAMLAPAVKKRQNFVGIEPGGSTSREEFVRFIRADRARWAKIIRDANVKVE